MSNDPFYDFIRDPAAVWKDREENTEYANDVFYEYINRLLGNVMILL